MGSRSRDLVATLLVIAIGIPYVGYLVRGEMPFVQDPRGMSATGLVLGLVAFFAAARQVPRQMTSSPHRAAPGFRRGPLGACARAVEDFRLWSGAGRCAIIRS
jgi:hypothetical protein